jgi:putative tryptophan/tyrosine transport system substrate-binding protein
MQRVAGITLQREPVHNSTELERVIGEVAREPGGSLILTSDPVIVSNLRLTAGLAEQLKVPAVSIYRQYVVDGGLMSYGPGTADIFRRSASYVDRILKGEKPADASTDHLQFCDQSAGGEDAWSRDAPDIAPTR